MNKRVDCDPNAGAMDIQVAKGLGMPVEEYVEALIGKRVQTERFEKGEIVAGETLQKTRVVFRFQGRQTHLDLDN
jgi:hypothetical protein